MKHLHFAAALASSLLLLAACGDEVTEVTEVTEVKQVPIAVVSSEKDLPDCGKDNDGSFVITKDQKDVFVCYSEKWYTLNGLDGSGSDGKDGADGKNGKDGKNGSDGEDGVGCMGVAFESGDSTGFKIVCGKDTLGVILNGRDGVDGADGTAGRRGMVPGLAKKLAKRMKRGVNTAAFDSPGKKNYKGFDENGIVSDYYLWDDPTHFDRLEKKHFKMLADKGFDNIRIQVRWETHFTGDASKCQIDSVYMRQVKWAVENTIQNGMIAVVNEQDIIFQMTATGDNAKGNGYTYETASPCEKAIYTQIANAMSEYSPESVVIELPNEPTFEPDISAKQWNNLIDSLIQIIHGIDPARVIMVGSRNFYSKDYLSELELDNADGLLIASFHYYDPFDFTSAGCGAANVDVDTCGNVQWEGNASQRKRIYNDFKGVSEWSKAHGDIPIYLGEFGTKYLIKDTVGAEKWISYVIQAADMFDFATAVYSFGGGHYVYNFKKEEWADFKIRALFNPKYDLSLKPGDYDLTKLSSMPLESFDTEDFPKNALLGDEEWRMFANNVTAKNGAGETYSDNFESFISGNGHTENAFYGKFEIKAPGGEKYPSFGFNIEVPATKRNMSSVKAISFWAKGSGLLRVGLPTAYADSLRENSSAWVGDFSAEVKLTSEWQQHVIWSDDIVPEPNSLLDSLQVEWPAYSDRVTQIVFKQGSDLGPASNATVEWYLDDISIHGTDLSHFE